MYIRKYGIMNKNESILKGKNEMSNSKEENFGKNIKL